MLTVEESAARAKIASKSVMFAPSEKKNDALLKAADKIEENTEKILAANALDLARARENNMTLPLQDRLSLTEARIKALAQAVRDVAKLKDPIGETLDSWSRPNGLLIKKIRVPMGVIGIIYEARPNVTADAAALCLKAGSACVLRGGKDAFHSNAAICQAMREALAETDISPDVISMVESLDRESSVRMMKLNGVIDVLIPRGGAGLIQSVVQNATVPVIETGTGNCHIYVDESADIDMAVRILINAKTQRTGVCNAAESLLVHKNIADAFLPKALDALSEKGCKILGCERTCAIYPTALPATDKDFATEFLDLIISVKVVDSTDEAIEHIEKYSTHHSETIVTKSDESAEKFFLKVNSAAVYKNASTRFTDGGEFGFGAEMGISTQKLHARGPMGLNEITTYKYVIEGNGQIR